MNFRSFFVKISSFCRERFASLAGATNRFFERLRRSEKVCEKSLLVFCCIFLVIAFLIEGRYAYPVLQQEEEPSQEDTDPFDLQKLVRDYRLRETEARLAAPCKVVVGDGQRLSLTLDSLKNYRLASAPAGWTVDLSQLEGSGSERAAYCHDYINSDTIGWLTVPGTNIDYPVMQGQTLTTYMDLDINRSYSYNGSLWVDVDVTDYSTNTVIFGHNWTNVSSSPAVGRPGDVMFAQLPSFAHLWFAQRVPYFYYSTASQDMVWQVFAAFYTTDLDFYLYVNFTGSALQSIIDKGRSLSLHNYNVNVSSSDRIITLSTCTRALGQSEDQRFVVMAKLVSSGDANVQITD